MRLLLILISAILICSPALSCAPEPVPDRVDEVKVEPQNPGNNDTPPVESPTQSQETNMTIRVIVGDKEFKADIEESETGKAFISKLPLTLNMSELNGNEKYCYGVSLPKADKYFASISAGDLMLYSGNCVVLFYGAAGGYNYTRIGKLKSTEGLAAALGKGAVSVKFDR